MNDAEAIPVSEPGLSRVAWFQVVRTNPAPDGVPLQAFLACVGDVVERLGTLRLEAMQVVIPSEEFGEGGLRFADREKGRRRCPRGRQVVWRL